MTYKTYCIEKNITSLIQLVRIGDEEYKKIDENGDSPFYYFTYEYNEIPEMKQCNEENYLAFKRRTRDDTDGTFEYNQGYIPIHTCIVSTYCPSLKVSISETAALIFIEWCYFKMSKTLEQMTPYFAFQKCSELLQSYECKEIWSYLNDYILYTINGKDSKKCIADICFDYLFLFTNHLSIQDHPELFKRMVKCFFSHFKKIGGSTFISHFTSSFLELCLEQLIDNSSIQENELPIETQSQIPIETNQIEIPPVVDEDDKVLFDLTENIIPIENKPIETEINQKEQEKPSIQQIQIDDEDESDLSTLSDSESEDKK